MSAGGSGGYLCVRWSTTAFCLLGPVRQKCHLLLANSYIRTEWTKLRPSFTFSLCSFQSSGLCRRSPPETWGIFDKLWGTGLNACLRFYVGRIRTWICSSVFLDSTAKCRNQRSVLHRCLHKAACSVWAEREGCLCACAESLLAQLLPVLLIWMW